MRHPALLLLAVACVSAIAFSAVATPAESSTTPRAAAAAPGVALAPPVPVTLEAPRAAASSSSTSSPSTDARVALPPTSSEPPATVEEALARELGLSPAETEQVAETIREADARLRADMAALAQRGYDDLEAQRLGERFEEELLAQVEATLPADRRHAFRALMEKEHRALDDRR
jgi:hypothetical protein